MTLDEMLIRNAIQYTIGRYCSAIDRACYDELTEVFTPDAVVTFCNAPSLIGHQHIVSTMTNAAEKRGSLLPQNFQRHLLGNSIINVLDSQNAKAVHYISVISELGPDHSGVYIDDFVKSGERWLIARRQANVEWVRPDSRFAAAHGGPAPTARPQLNIGYVRPVGS
jgi:hypothetical protein